MYQPRWIHRKWNIWGFGTWNVQFVALSHWFSWEKSSWRKPRSVFFWLVWWHHHCSWVMMTLKDIIPNNCTSFNNVQLTTRPHGVIRIAEMSLVFQPFWGTHMRYLEVSGVFIAWGLDFLGMFLFVCAVVFVTVVLWINDVMRRYEPFSVITFKYSHWICKAWF